MAKSPEGCRKSRKRGSEPQKPQETREKHAKTAAPDKRRKSLIRIRKRVPDPPPPCPTTGVDLAIAGVDWVPAGHVEVAHRVVVPAATNARGTVPPDAGRVIQVWRTEPDPEPLDPSQFREWPAVDRQATLERLEWDRARRRQAMADAFAAMIAHAVATLPPEDLPKVVAALARRMATEVEALVLEHTEVVAGKRKHAGRSARHAEAEAEAFEAVGRLMLKGESLEQAALTYAVQIAGSEKTVGRWVLAERRRRVFQAVRKHLADGKPDLVAAADVSRDWASSFPIEPKQVLADYRHMQRRAK